MASPLVLFTSFDKLYKFEMVQSLIKHGNAFICS